MIDGIYQPIEFNARDPRVQRVYPDLFRFATAHLQGDQEGSKRLLTHLEYMKKIFGEDVGGHLVGTALNDANQIIHINQRPEIN